VDQAGNGTAEVITLAVLDHTSMQPAATIGFVDWSRAWVLSGGAGVSVDVGIVLQIDGGYSY
jgi:hypothetical protein